MKKFLSIILVLALILSISACSRDTGTTETPPTEGTETGGTETGDTGSTEPADDYKIGIITGTVSQGEEEFQAAQNMVKKYGDKIVTATYPDNFSSETETTIANVVGLASDPAVKAIVFVQAVPGAAAAVDKVRETRPDMLFVLGVVAEDPATIASKADVAMLVDELSMGYEIPKKAKEMGAKTLIHYSFARHLSYASIAERRARMIEECERQGIEFVDVTAPDPTGDAGTSGAQQFILEDVPRQVEKYGKDTAFFSTNCSMQEPLIRSIWDLGAIFPQQCCPSPYHGYPAALNISVDGHEGDVQYMLDQIAVKLKEKGQEKRMSTWAVPINMLMVDAGVDYSIAYIEGKATSTNDTALLTSVINDLSKNQVTMSNYEVDGKKLDNFYLLLSAFYDFSK